MLRRVLMGKKYQFNSSSETMIHDPRTISSGNQEVSEATLFRKASDNV